MGPDLGSLRIGEWLVDVRLGELVRGDRRVPLEPRRLAVLLALAERPGEVLDLDALTHAGWGDTPVSPDSVYQAIAQLRRALGDDAANPRYIATVARRGYRLVATVESLAGAAPPTPTPAAEHPIPRHVIDDRRRALVGLGLFGLAGASVVAWRWPQPVMPGIVRLAVMPFGHAAAGGAGADALADGIARDVIQGFEGAAGVQVIASQSAFQLRPVAAAPIDLASVRQRLDADLVLVGEVDRLDHRARATVRLLGAEDGRTRLSRTFEQPIERAASLPGQIVAATLESLKVAAMPTEPTGASLAYERLLEGVHAFQPRTPEAIHAARDLFEQAIDLDRSYARAYAFAAVTWIAEVDFGFGLDARSAAARAQPLIDRAFALQPDLVEIDYAQAYVDINLGRYEPAQRRLLAIVKRAPGNAQARFTLGTTYDWGADERSAIEQYRVAESLDPLNWLVQRRLGMALMWLGQHDEAARHFDRTVDLAPQSTAGRWGHASNAWSQGKVDVAARDYLAAIAINPRHGTVWNELAWCWLDLGLADRARAAFASQLPLVRLPGEVMRDMGRLAIVDGRLDELAAHVDRSGVLDSSEPGVAADGLLLAAIGGRAIDAAKLDAEVARMRADPTPWVGSYDVFLGQDNWLQMATLYTMLGRRDDAEALIADSEALHERIRRFGNRYHALPFHEARIAALRGQKDVALGKLEEATSLGWQRAWWTRVDPAFVALRGEARFEATLTKAEAVSAGQRQAIS